MTDIIHNGFVPGYIPEIQPDMPNFEQVTLPKMALDVYCLTVRIEQLETFIEKLSHLIPVENTFVKANEIEDIT